LGEQHNSAPGALVGSGAAEAEVDRHAGGQPERERSLSLRSTLEALLQIEERQERR
jgi:hypothetical protein